MSDYLIALPPQAKNLKPKMLSYTREGKDGNEIVVPLFGGDSFVGEVLGGKWQKYVDSSLAVKKAYISGGALIFDGQSDGSGTPRIMTLTSKSQLLIREGLTVEVHLELSDIPASNGHAISLVLAPEYEPADPESSPVNSYNFILYAGSSNYTVWTKQNIDGTVTYPLTGQNITNSECKYKIVFFNQDGKLKYRLYYHDGTDPFTDDDEVDGSPFEWECPFTVAYVYMRYWIDDNSNHQGGSNYITVDYGADVNIPQLIKFDVPFGEKAGVETVLEEAEACTLGAGVGTTDLADDSGTSVVLDAQTEYALLDFNPVEDTLSKGRYLALIRIKDTNQITNDVVMGVKNYTDDYFMNVEKTYVYHTAEGTWKVYELLFDVTDEDIGDDCYIYVQKAQADANTIYIDWFRVIPYDGLNGGCRCFDTMGEASEDDWVEVFDPDHAFVGDKVIQNGLVRVTIVDDGYYGTTMAYWNGIEWIEELTRIDYILDSASRDCVYSLFKHMIFLSSERIKFSFILYNILNSYWVEIEGEIERGKRFVSYTLKTVYPPQNSYSAIRSTYTARFGYFGDAETHGIGERELHLQTENTTLTDNFCIGIDPPYDRQCLQVFSSDKQPSSHFGNSTLGGAHFYYKYILPNALPTKLFTGMIPFSRIGSLFAETENSLVSCSSRLNFDGDGEDTVTENDGVWTDPYTNTTIDENNGVENSVGSACVSLTSDGAGTAGGKCTPASPLSILKFDTLKLYLHGNPNSNPTIYLEDDGGKFCSISQAITGAATQYSIDLPHSETDTQGWSVAAGFNFAGFSYLYVAWAAAGAAEVVYVDGLHFYIGTTTDRGRGEDLSNDEAVVLDANNEYCRTLSSFTIKDLPIGRYLFVARAKVIDSDQSDFRLAVYNTTAPARYDNEEATETVRTLTTSFAYYHCVFDIYEDSVTFFYTLKRSAAENTILVDYFLIIPIGEGLDFPQDLSHNALRESRKEKALSDPRLDV